MIRRSGYIWIITVALGLVLACGPVSTGLSPSPTGDTSSKPSSEPTSSAAGELATQAPTLVPNPLNVQVTLDTAAAQTSSGIFNVQTASGASFAGIVPEGMVSMDASGILVPAYDTPVTITPVTSIEGIPFSQGFLAAFQFGPDGMLMVEPAKFTLILPGEYDPATLVAFAWDGNGNNFHLFPAAITAGLNMPGLPPGGPIVTFEILHFSGVGVAEATPQEIETQHARVPEGQSNQDDDLLSPLPPRSEEDAALHQSVVDIYSRKHDLQIKPAVDRVFAIEDDCNYVDVVAQEFINWHTRVKAVGLDYEFTEEIDRDTAVLLASLVKCMIPTCSLCLGTPPGDKQKTDSFLIHSFYAEQIAKIAGLPDETFRWWTLANQCAANTGRRLPHANTDAGCGNDCPVGDTATMVPPVCPLP
jgi:hypothetical protein